MSTVRQALQGKSATVWSVPPTATVYEALQLMADKDIGAVVVMAATGRLLGIFSERDYARKVVLKGRSSRDVSVGELMTSKVYVVDPDRTIEDCMRLMTTRKIRHLPVLEQDRLVGIITIGDVVKHVISQQAFTIEQLERYITGPSFPGT